MAELATTTPPVAAGPERDALLATKLHVPVRPVAWLALDEGDNDPARFWRHAGAALDTVHHESIQAIAPDFTYVDVGRRFPQARLVVPTTSGYLLLAAEVDRRPMFLPNSRAKRRLLRQIQRLLRGLRADQRVLEAVAFDGLLTPARRGELLEQRPEVPVARFDLAVLVETTSPTTAAELEAEPLWGELVATIEAASRRSYHLRGHNVRRMGPVDHHRQGVFLFNYFYADRTDLNLAALQYTAGWFADQTGLDNSTVLLPDDTSEPRYRLVNHARWDRLADVLPSLIFKRSFRTYVLAHFKANGVAAMPVLYRLVPDPEERG